MKDKPPSLINYFELYYILVLNHIGDAMKIFHHVIKSFTVATMIWLTVTHIYVSQMTMDMFRLS
jgi:hypothetical protein